MKRILSVILASVAAVSLFGLSTLGAVGEGYGDLVGEANSDAVYSIGFSAPETYIKGGEIVLSVSVNGITAPDGLSLVRFNLYYDNSKLVITNDIDEKDGGNAKILDFSKLEGTHWEEVNNIESNFNGLSEEAINNGAQAVPSNNGFVGVGAATDRVGAETVSEDGKIVFNFNFTVKNNATGDIVIYIPNASVKGACLTETGGVQFMGNGGFCVIKAEDASDEPENSEDTSSEDTSSEDTSSQDTSSEDTSSEDTSSEDTSSEDTSSDGTSDDTSSDTSDDTYDDVVLADVDFDGDIDTADYILLKRAVLKTYNLTDEQKTVADIDKDGDVDTADYVLVKRIVLGTYTVKQD